MTKPDLIPSLTRMREAEERNYEVSLERMGETATLVQDFVDAYDSLSRVLRQTSDPADHLIAVSLQLLSTAYQLEKACLECLRGRLTDSTQITRRAIEAAGSCPRMRSASLRRVT